MRVTFEVNFDLVVTVVSFGHLTVVVDVLVLVTGVGEGTSEEQAELMVLSGQEQSCEGVGAHCCAFAGAATAAGEAAAAVVEVPSVVLAGAVVLVDNGAVLLELLASVEVVVLDAAEVVDPEACLLPTGLRVPLATC